MARKGGFEQEDVYSQQARGDDGVGEHLSSHHQHAHGFFSTPSFWWINRYVNVQQQAVLT